MDQNPKSNIHFYDPISELYAKSRPGYPKELFSYLAGQSQCHDLVWDAATGNGQAAIGLKDFFKKVIATDISENQLHYAFQHPSIQYQQSSELVPFIEDLSVDLITVSSAIHWLDRVLFYKEADRVLKNKGILATWGYSGIHLNEEVDAAIIEMNETILKPYIVDQVVLAINGYKAIHLPFEPLITPEFFINFFWDKEQVMDYLMTWSSSQNFILNQPEKDLREELMCVLEKYWGNEEKKEIQFKLIMKASRKP